MSEPFWPCLVLFIVGSWPTIEDWLQRKARAKEARKVKAGVARVLKELTEYNQGGKQSQRL